MCNKLYAHCKQVCFHQITANTCITNNCVQLNTSLTILKLHKFELDIYEIFSSSALYDSHFLSHHLIRGHSNVTRKEAFYFRIDLL